MPNLSVARDIHDGEGVFCGSVRQRAEAHNAIPSLGEGRTDMRKVLVLVAVVLGGLLIVASGAADSDTVCVGVLGGTHDNVVVPPGSSCTLAGATVKGNVKTYGAFRADGATIGGDVDAEPGHLQTRLFGTMVGGNVQISDSVGFGSSDDFIVVVINGNFQYQGNPNRLFLVRSVISGNVKVEKNTAPSLIEGNFIGGNVECKENAPPTVEGFNNVSGTDRDKCPE